MNVNGIANRPMRKDNEKFSVARAERNIPRVRREKHLMSLRCTVVTVKVKVRRVEIMGGRRRFRAPKA